MTVKRIIALILSVVMFGCRLPMSLAENDGCCYKTLRSFDADDTLPLPGASYITLTEEQHTSANDFCLKAEHTKRIATAVGDEISVPLAESGIDLSDVSELWFYLDVTEYSGDARLKISFSEKVSNKKRQFGIRPECCVLLVYENGTTEQAVADDGNYITVPSDFCGYVRVSLDTATLVKLTRAAAYNISKKQVDSVEFTVHIGPQTLGGIIRLDDIGIYGKNVSGVNTSPATVLKAPLPEFADAPGELTLNKKSGGKLLDFSAGGNNDYRRYFIVEKPEHGDLTVSAYSGVAYYSPHDDYVGRDEFKIGVIDENYGVNEAVCIVSVLSEELPEKQEKEATVLPGGSKQASGDIPDALKKPLESYITNMDLSGYVGDEIDNNIKNWLLTVQDDYPEIIDYIKDTPVDGAIDVASVVWDTEAMQKNGVFSYGVKQYGGANKRALTVTHNIESEYRGFELRFGGVPGSVTDISGYDCFIIGVDISDYGEKGVPFSLGFYDLISSGDGSYGSEKTTFWAIKKGASISLCNEENNVLDVTATETPGSDGAYIMLPPGFVGTIRIPITEEVFARSSYSSDAPEVITGKNVSFYKIILGANETSLNKTAYIYSVAASGAAGRDNLVFGAESLKYNALIDLNIISTTDYKKYTYEVFPWYGEFAGKILTGMSYVCRVDNDEQLVSAATRFADSLCAAQDPDGYIGIYNGIGVMGGNGFNWDLWNHYHAIYGLYQWYLVTGNEKYLNAAVSAADFVYNWFSASDKLYSSAGSETMNLAISHAFAVLYKQTHDKRYLDAAQSIVVSEWPESGDWMNSILNGKDYYEGRYPRWEALHSVMTLSTLYEITGDERYYTALCETFWSIVKTDRHNTGGFSTGEQASGTPFADGAIETCCTIAYMALGTQVLRLSGDSIAADEMELSYLNAMLGSLIKEASFSTYNTPMSGEKNPSYSMVSGSGEKPAVTCCQANSSRGLGEISQWAVLTGDDSLYQNYYGRSNITTKTPKGNRITISQTTDYPVSGKIGIKLEMEQSESFTYRLRIPSWTKNATVTFNGQVSKAVSGKYFDLKSEFKNGDVIEIDIPLSVHYLLGENEKSGKASVYYGPILLTLDDGYTPDYLNGTTVFDTDGLEKAIISSAGNKGGILSFDAEDTKGNAVRFIDFASSGKNGTGYNTWILLHHSMGWVDFKKSGNPTWNNTTGDIVRIYRGDLNSDGKITAVDALLALQVSVGKIEITDRIMAVGDVNSDDKVNATDALIILQCAVGKIPLSDE